jgi:branched-chain amino acid transport system ATP-binding protein
MLKLVTISSGYDKKQVLFDVSFEVGSNELVLLTGGNGSGKSTILKCIYGLLPLWNNEAKIVFNGKDITNLETSMMVREGIVYIPQKNNYFESLTIHENLIVSGSLYSKDLIKKRIQEIYEVSGLYNYRKRTPFNLSGGERQLLALGIALMHKPKFILFDEPFAGLDENNSKLILNELLKLKHLGVSMLIVEHKKSIDAFADKVINLYLGKIILN